ncbi:MAG: ribonuclease [Clostridia bacterium]|nr:ribonuclease [Clostridiales bacterium]MDK2984726.1 ribonuclease [Clostridia bacterium]
MKKDEIKIEKLTIKQLEEYLKNKDHIETEILQAMHNDSRLGVQKLLQRYQQKIKQLELEKKRLEKLFFYERKLYMNSIYPVAGIDEAGRGPLAGPVFAAAVILPLECNITGLKDSKKVSKARREELFEEIKEKSLAWGVGYCSAKVIDSYNILEATKLAMVKAITRLKIKPVHILIDALKLDLLSIPQTSLVKGEDKSASIAAASIIAKVSRDKYMENISKKYPQYNFEIHKGYPTKEHYECIKRFGPCPEHRLTFAGVIKENN